MKLSDLRKKDKNQNNDKEFIAKVVQTFEKNEEQYNKNSTKWIIRITADELNIKQDDLITILEKYYEGTPNVRPQ